MEAGLLDVDRGLAARCGRSPDRATRLTEGLLTRGRPSVRGFDGFGDPSRVRRIVASQSGRLAVDLDLLKGNVAQR